MGECDYVVGRVRETSALEKSGVEIRKYMIPQVSPGLLQGGERGDGEYIEISTGQRNAESLLATL